MNEVTNEEMCRLLVPANALPEFKARGLDVWFGEVGRFALATFAGPPNDDVAINLADATTRDRAARWLAGRLDLKIATTAPLWEWESDLHGWAVGVWSPAGQGERIVWRTARIPTIDALDPTDDRRLPDGSRYIDALALALAATHIGSTP